MTHFESEVVAGRIAEEPTLGHANNMYNERVMCFILIEL